MSAPLRRGHFYRLVAAAGCVLAAFAVAILPGAASAHPRLTIEPVSVALAPGASERIVVRVEGPIAGDASISAIGPTTLTAAAEPLERNRRRQWIVTVKAGSRFVEDANLVLKLRSGSQISAIALPVKAKAAPSVDTVLAMTLSFEGDTLLAGLDRPLLVRLSNLSDLPLEVTLTPHLPNFLMTKGDSWRRKTLAPRSTVVTVIPLDTRSDGVKPVISGKHEVVVMASARREGGGWTGQTAASTTLSVGVPGMEAVQGVLQVPSFLLLPGFLFVAAYMLTAKAVKPVRAPETEKGSLLSLGWSAGHWVVAVTISMAIVAIYPQLMRLWIGAPRSILYGFDLGDVIRVWVLSLLSGIALALLIAAARQLRAKWLARYAFDSGLAPLDLLDRLARRGISTTLPYVVDTKGGRIFCLLRVHGQAEAWAASTIAVEVKDRTKFDVGKFSLATATGEAADIGAQLRDAVAAGAVMVEWSATDAVRGVARLPATTFDSPEAGRSIVEPV